ncbi:MAG: right-handed parallel beta-helix repeat-containing protein [Planctomycetes bacterium]|nr:right-handed parallel beta-helix repeat-containing protein [Planctomycetota bacterium]
MRVGTSLVVGFIGLLGIADGAVITVPSPGINTIQNGIDASSSGDVIRIKAGLYEETVTIGVNQGGITLVGVGKVILDARPSAIASGPGLEVLGSGVTVKNITIRCAVTGLGGDGHGLLVDANAFTGSKIVVQHCEASGIHMLSLDSTLTNCRVEAVGGAGIHAEFASGLVLKSCVVRGAGGVGLELDGAGILVDSCRVRGSRGNGIEVVGSDAIVRKCVVENADDDAIVADGLGALVDSCRLDTIDGVGIDADGADAIVRRCKITATQSFAIGCGGDNTRIEDNVLTRCRAGIVIGGTSQQVLRNRLTDTTLLGIDLDTCSQALVANNVIVRVGGAAISSDKGALETIRDNVVKDAVMLADTPVRAAFEISSVSATVSGNRLIGCGGDGIAITADDCEIVDNALKACMEDGIDVESGDACIIDGNVVLGCTGEGIENNGTNTTITNNVMKKNRIDLANDGTLDDVLGNVFTTGGTNEVPLIDF